MTPIVFKNYQILFGDILFLKHLLHPVLLIPRRLIQYLLHPDYPLVVLPFELQ